MIDKDNQVPYLGRIKIRGYKSIKALDLKMDNLNVLIGANGAGKSNFISLFTFLNHLSQGKLQTYVEQQGFANSFFHFGVKRTSNMHLALQFEKNGYHVTFMQNTENDSLIFSEEYCTYCETDEKKWVIKGRKGESGLLYGSETESWRIQKYTRQYLNGCRVFHFHDTSETAGFKQASDIGASDYLYKDASNIASFLYRLKNDYPHSYRDIVDTIQTIAPFFHNFYLESRGQNGNSKVLLKWLHKKYDNPFSANQLSDGTARFICLITLLLQPAELRPNTIILDEPELGLHPAALEVLAETLKFTAKTTQIICSTQSVFFANMFNKDNFIVVDQVNGASEFRRLNDENLEHWLEDYGMGDIWAKNLIGGSPAL